VDPYQCTGEDKHTGDAVKEKATAHIDPAQAKDRYIENEIQYRNRQGREHVMDEQGHTGKSRSIKLLRDQNPVDGKATKGAAQRYESQIPDNLYSGFHPGFLITISPIISEY
jgi:ligand-binding sensor domain-containing protein